jgi:hypothetical protein
MAKSSKGIEGAKALMRALLRQPPKQHADMVRSGKKSKKKRRK